MLKLLKSDDIPAVPVAGDLQHQVDHLRDVLALPKLPQSTRRAEAREKLRVARQHCDTIASEVNDFLRQSPIRFGSEPTPAQRTELGRLSEANEAVEGALREFNGAVAGEAIAVQQAINKALDDAAPTLSEVLKLAHAAFNPLYELRRQDLAHGRASVRLVEAVPDFATVVRRITGLVNERVGAVQKLS